MNTRALLSHLEAVNVAARDASAGTNDPKLQAFLGAVASFADELRGDVLDRERGEPTQPTQMQPGASSSSTTDTPAS